MLGRNMAKIMTIPNTVGSFPSIRLHHKHRTAFKHAPLPEVLLPLKIKKELHGKLNKRAYN